MDKTSKARHSGNFLSHILRVKRLNFPRNMSLYYESTPFLYQDSLKSGVFSGQLKSKPKQVYALVSETSKWSSILKEIIEKSQILTLERKVSGRFNL